MTKNVLVPIADGTEELEAIALVDVLKRAGTHVTVASASGNQVTTAHGVKWVADCLVKDCVSKTFDLIVLPGGTKGAETFRDTPELIDMLKKQAQSGKWYAAICASPALVLEHHGLLKGKQATCYPSFADELSDKTSVRKRVVVDGNCVTSQGPGTAVEFALKLAEVMFDAKVSEQVASDMCVA